MARGLEIQHRFTLRTMKIPVVIGIFSLLAVVLGLLSYHYFTTGNLPAGISVAALEADPSIDESQVSRKQVDAHTVAADEPRYITIQKLNVTKARIFSVGVHKTTKQLGAPENLSDAAWYQKSAHPGDGYGAVLINAHSSGISRDGIFIDLKTLASGDEIIIERGDGKKFTYEVVENKSMSLDEVNKTGMKDMMHSVDEGKEGLNLITCDGNWVPQKQQFDRRVMLRAVLKD